MAMRCRAILDACSTVGLLSKCPANMKFLLCRLVCTLNLIQAITTTAGAVCLDSTVTFAVNSGVNASLPFNASDYENQKDFRVYRAQRNSIEFAHMTKDESKGDCSGPLSDLCVKGKIEFARDNQTHLLLVKIFHTTINDSGQYAVWTRFYSGNFHDDEKTAKCLKVINVKVEDNSTVATTSPVSQSTQVYSTSSSPETPTSPVSQSTQVYSPSSSSGPGGKTAEIVLGVLLAITLLIIAGGLLYYFRCLKKPKPSKSGRNGEEMDFIGV